VEENGRIEETRDGGITWHSLAIGLRTPWPQHMVERFFQIDGELWAVLSNGDLLVTSLAVLVWQKAASGVKNVNAMTVFPEAF